ncbi:pyridoxal phosphate-dependent aminotransferase [Phycisphaerales bacterium AB-hyl4]|uniref:Aminotransferase n=1 Tax=Natronomicrosphaera hydrolytica TaxID=3242702 RepID=A0ABV4U0A6_9BACT
MDADRFITDRLRAIDASGIRRVFDLAADLKDPINLSIGQPDFDVPDVVKDAACDAIRAGQNRYTQTQGIADLRDKVASRLAVEFPDTFAAADGKLPDDTGVLITSGVSGGLLLALMTCVGPGDEVLIPDPYFVMYRHLVTLSGATPVYVDTYPDFQLTADRLKAKITPRSKLLLFNSPSNPTGVVAPPSVCEMVVELARRHNLLLMSDEIYDEFCYEKVDGRCPSPMAYSRDTLLLRGFSKTYGMTGWRLGYAVGPRAIVEQMTKLQQYSFVCAPSMTQVAGVLAMDVDMSEPVEQYRVKRDRVVERLSPHYELTVPGGAFYAFLKVPEHLGMSATQFVEQAVKRGLLIIPGNVFSERDTHFRLSYACDNAMLDRGLDVLVELAKTKTP